VTQAPRSDILADAAFVAFGANVALAGKTLAEAVNQAIMGLDSPDCRLVRHSRLFHTPCFPAGTGPDYVNAVARFDTALAPDDLLTRLHKIETAMGRARVQRWGRRTMDLDLLAQGDLVLPDVATRRHWMDLAPEQQVLRAPDVLILPHPRLHERAFVLVPWLDIAPQWRHPVLGLTVAQMAATLPDADHSAVRPAAS